jgi:hypothetical protein
MKELPKAKFMQMAAIRAASLILLKTNALNALFKVVTLLVQKLISKNDVIPINSQPNNRVNQEPAITNKTIDHPNSLKYIRKFRIFFSKRM